MASPYRKLRARMLRTFFRAHAEVYERTGGRLGAHLGMPTLLLTTTGRASGLPRTTPLVYFRDGDAYVVVGSDGAARLDPHWVRNIAKDPLATIRVGRSVLAVHAHVAAGPERARLWELGKGVNPMWARYQTRTERELPVVVLEPRA